MYRSFGNVKWVKVKCVEFFKGQELKQGGYIANRATLSRLFTYDPDPDLPS